MSEQFIHPRIRDTHDSQRMAMQSRLGVANERLIAAIDMMEAASDEPRPVQAIAADVDLSPRQLERLFARYLRASPSRHYLKMRLERARAMLLQTTKPILDVAVACGLHVGLAFQPLLSRGVWPQAERRACGACEQRRSGRAGR